jgi:hypothetical protein
MNMTGIFIHIIGDALVRKDDIQAHYANSNLPRF